MISSANVLLLSSLFPPTAPFDSIRQKLSRNKENFPRIFLFNALGNRKLSRKYRKKYETLTELDKDEILILTLAQNSSELEFYVVSISISIFYYLFIILD